jgi:hypothetical protein
MLVYVDDIIYFSLSDTVEHKFETLLSQLSTNLRPYFIPLEMLTL